jgi:hypothetical protein
MDIRMCGAVVAGACASAVAQEDSATWLWDVTTQDGDEVVEPGETATVTLSLLMEVEAGKGEQIALAGVLFDTLGGDNAAIGSVGDWTVLNDLADIFGDLTTTDGVSLFGTFGVNCFGIQMFPCSLDNPIDVLAFEWSTDDYSHYSVDYTTSTNDAAVWRDLFDEQEFLEVQTNEALISFQVVPAPATLAICAWVIAVPALWRWRRTGVGI